MPLVFLLVLLVLSPLAVGQETPPPEQSSQNDAPPPPPSVTVSPVGVVVISGASQEAPAPEGTKKGEDDEPEKPSAKDEAAGGTDEAAADKPPPTTSRTTKKYTYDLSGRASPTGITVSGHSSSTARSVTRRLRNSSGREVPYLTESEHVLSRTSEGEVIERRTHRYDTAGDPVSQQLVRDEERLLPDGSVQHVVTVYESDINGRMQPMERRTTVEKKVGNTTRTVTTTERPAINRRLQVSEREESVRTEHGDTSAKIETVRKVDNGGGRLIESERQESTLTRSGNVATTETKVWKRSVVNQDRLEPLSRTVGKLVENPDGSSTETVEMYAASSGGGAVNLNAGGTFELQQITQRETRKGAQGETFETTTTRSRSIADPSRMGGREVVRSVSRPTVDGERIETHSYEEGVNRRLRQTGMLVEEIQKQ